MAARHPESSSVLGLPRNFVEDLAKYKNFESYILISRIVQYVEFCDIEHFHERKITNLSEPTNFRHHPIVYTAVIQYENEHVTWRRVCPSVATESPV
jgi:hypothetical protein